MKVWSGVKSILERTPLTVKFYIGFVLFGFLLIGSVSLHAYIKSRSKCKAFNYTSKN